jgi:hypothetical protein
MNQKVNLIEPTTRAFVEEVNKLNLKCTIGKQKKECII